MPASQESFQSISPYQDKLIVVPYTDKLKQEFERARVNLPAREHQLQIIDGRFENNEMSYFIVENREPILFFMVNRKADGDNSMTVLAIESLSQTSLKGKAFEAVLYYCEAMASLEGFKIIKVDRPANIPHIQNLLKERGYSIPPWGCDPRKTLQLQVIVK